MTGATGVCSERSDGSRGRCAGSIIYIVAAFFFLSAMASSVEHVSSLVVFSVPARGSENISHDLLQACPVFFLKNDVLCGFPKAL